MRQLSVCLLFTVLLLAAGCRNKTALDANGVPYKLVVAVYEGDNPGETSGVLKKVKAYLERKLAIPVEFQESTDYTTIIEAMVAGKAHMAYLSPFSYILATQKQRLVPLAAPGFHGKPFSYKSYIFTNPGTGLHSMEDVKARSHQLTLCFADPASTSGHLVPRSYLTTIGLDPKTAFKQTMFAGTHAASLLSVKAGKVDLGCAFQFAYDKMLRDGSLKPGELIVLWESGPIPESPVCMRPEVSPAFTQKVKEAFLRMPQDGPEAFHAYMSMYFPKQADSLSYISVDDTLFDGLRKIATSIGDLTPTKK
ncbi:MAG TPA: phosphate/phosphite/phosphonate ABC transporter substrate-binding protein [Puia sp.]|jgi:phosphonate transport system substrate-binding protein|nr:phosphate/phosphite/phosphonate ABC transporter substrate-binding protein [Puia sp.]